MRPLNRKIYRISNFECRRRKERKKKRPKPTFTLCTVHMKSDKPHNLFAVVVVVVVYRLKMIIYILCHWDSCIASNDPWWRRACIPNAYFAVCHLRSNAFSRSGGQPSRWRLSAVRLFWISLIDALVAVNYPVLKMLRANDVTFRLIELLCMWAKWRRRSTRSDNEFMRSANWES